MPDTSEKVGAVIVAAGKSERMGNVDKMFALLGGQPLLLRTTQPFQQCPQIDQVVVVVSGEREPHCRSLVAGPEWSKVSDVCLGGRRRQDSVAEGLKHLTDCAWVVIHDGARPLVTVELIERGLKAARETGAAIAAVPVTDTIKVSDDGGTVVETPPRQYLWAVQTPQIFTLEIISEAYQNADEDVTDSSSLVERLGHKVKLYMGAHDNIKITTPADLALAEILWQQHER
ncbi:MAG: 2-C-methyl-D-erythritol 4-phosphate cytidylyltransferase [Dehalococcoidales bacterium]|nr:2-C-methyl-D-erythritol 4-phosphate cytidylyltransferase [Dehalococcoidales bacterium]